MTCWECEHDRHDRCDGHLLVPQPGHPPSEPAPLVAAPCDCYRRGHVRDDKP